MESHFFMGACSCEGFVSHYDSLFHEVKDLTIIKGGSGCGKSTFMKAIGKAAAEKGMDVTYILCSSDPDSLDGVLIPSLSVGFVDGTAPHVLEPILCGGSANYLNFGEFYDREAMKANEDAIFAVQRKNKEEYIMVYSCFNTVKSLLECIRCKSTDPFYEEEMAAIAECLCLSAIKPKWGKGSLSRRFITALTPKGIQVCSSTPAVLCPKVYALKDDYLLAPMVLSMVEKKALSNGYHCISCYTPLLPRALPSYLLIPELGVAFVSDSNLFRYTGDYFCTIDLNTTLSPKIQKELAFVGRMTADLLQVITTHLQTAKEYHDRIEALCRPFVNFDQVSEMTDRTIRRLFS